MSLCSRLIRKGTTYTTVLLVSLGVLWSSLPVSAQGFGQILGGTVGGSVLQSGVAIGADRRFTIVRPRLTIDAAHRTSAVTQLEFNRELDLLLVVLANGNARLWDLRRGIERIAIRDLGIVRGVVRGRGSAAQIVAVRADGSSTVVSLEGARHSGSERIPDLDQGAHPALARDGETLAFRVQDGSWWVRTRYTDRFVLSRANADAFPAFSVDGSKLLYRVEQGHALQIVRFGRQGAQPIGVLTACSESAQITSAQFTPVGSRVVVGDSSGRICLWDVSTVPGPRLLYSVQTDLNGPVRVLAVDHEGLHVAVGDGLQAIEVWPLSGRIDRILSVALESRSSAALALDSKRGWLLVGSLDGTVIVYDVNERDSEHRPIGQLISTKIGWSVLDSSGRFDGSQNGIDALSWTGEELEGDGIHVLPVDSFSESHYEPGLLTKLDKPESSLLNHSAPDLRESGYVRPADVMIELAEQDATGRLAVMVRTETGYPAERIAGLRLYHNGKLVADAGGRATLEANVQLLPGENVIRAVAVGHDGLEGRPATRTTAVSGMRGSPTLNVLAIGINDYSNAAWELFYPRNDAEAIVSTLQDRASRLRSHNGNLVFGDVRTNLLLDRSAQKSSIESQILRSAADADDVLVIYFAGHGYALQDEQGWEWYLLPYSREWRKRTASPEKLDNLIRQHGLSSRRLMALLTHVGARRIFLVLDSCYSGALVEAVEGVTSSTPRAGDDSATIKALRRLARIGGLHVLAASRAHEKATELQLEPHGALTYLVLEGVRGAADTNGDRNVSVREVIDYATVEMPNLADRLIQQPISQRPLGYSNGVNFTVSGL